MMWFVQDGQLLQLRKESLFQTPKIIGPPIITTSNDDPTPPAATTVVPNATPIEARDAVPGIYFFHY